MSKEDDLPTIISKKDAIRAMRRVTEHINQTHSDSFRYDGLEEFIIDALRYEIDGVVKIGKLAGEQLSLLSDGQTQQEQDQEFQEAGFRHKVSGATELS